MIFIGQEDHPLEYSDRDIDYCLIYVTNNA
jgi:hypothetical protein